MNDIGRILVVDSDSSTQRLLSAIVLRNHLHAAVVPDGTAALLRLATEEFDAILLDLVLPRTNGAEVLRVMASVMPHLLERVIVVTSAPEELVQNCPHLSATWTVVRKPIEVDVLEQELLECYAERMRVAGRRAPRHAPAVERPYPMKLAN